MADFASTISGVKDLGGCSLVYGTWAANDSVNGVILFTGNRNTVSLTTTPGSTTLTTSGSYTTSDIKPGDLVEGAEIVPGTYVTAVASATSLTISKAATGTTEASRKFTRLRGTMRDVIDCSVISSTSYTTMTAVKVEPVINAMAVTCLANDAGYWSVTVK